MSTYIKNTYLVIVKFLFKKLNTSKKYISNKIKLFNFGFGEISETKELNVFKDTSSSTLNYINENTEYFKRKKKLFSLFLSNQNFKPDKQNVKICNISEFISEQSVEKIDILKIDTEGYEYNILKGIKEIDLKKIRFIYFEHGDQ